MTSLPYKKQLAFTLVELLMTVSIMMIVMSVAVVNYLRFLDKQRLYQDGAGIEAILKDARIKAQNGYLGNDEIGYCAQLAAVEVYSAINAENLLTVTARLRCANNNLLPYETQVISQADTVIDQQFSISFLSLRGATLSMGGSQVASGAAILARNDNQVILNLDQGGAINVKFE